MLKKSILIMLILCSVLFSEDPDSYWVFTGSLKIPGTCHGTDFCIYLITAGTKLFKVVSDGDFTVNNYSLVLRSNEMLFLLTDMKIQLVGKIIKEVPKEGEK